MSVLLRCLFLLALTSSLTLFVFALGLCNCCFSDALASYLVLYKLAPPFLSHGLTMPYLFYVFTCVPSMTPLSLWPKDSQQMDVTGVGFTPAALSDS